MDDRKKFHCALWLQSCSRTHKLWCDCLVWTSHIKGWQGLEDGDGGGAAERDQLGSEKANGITQNAGSEKDEKEEDKDE
nr:ORF2 [Torque teno felis virus]